MTQRAADEQAAAGILDEDGGNIAGVLDGFLCARVDQRRTFPERLSGDFVHRNDERVTAAGNGVDRFGVDQQAFTESPGDVLSSERLQEIDGPLLAAVGRIERSHSAMGVLEVDAAPVVGGGGAGAGIGILPRGAIGGGPQGFAGEIEGDEVEPPVDVTGDEQPVVRKDRGREAAPEIGHRPERGGPGRGPLGEQAAFVGDPVAFRPSELRPARFVAGDESGLCRSGSCFRSANGGQQERRSPEGDVEGDRTKCFHGWNAGSMPDLPAPANRPFQNGGCRLLGMAVTQMSLACHVVGWLPSSALCPVW